MKIVQWLNTALALVVIALAVILLVIVLSGCGPVDARSDDPCPAAGCIVPTTQARP